MQQTLCKHLLSADYLRRHPQQPLSSCLLQLDEPIPTRVLKVECLVPGLIIEKSNLHITETVQVSPWNDGDTLPCYSLPKTSNWNCDCAIDQEISCNACWKDFWLICSLNSDWSITCKKINNSISKNMVRWKSEETVSSLKRLHNSLMNPVVSYLCTSSTIISLE